MHSDAVTDTAVFTVHEDEMTAEMAASLSAQADLIGEYFVRRPAEGIDGTRGFEVVSLLVPRAEIPGGKAAHIEYADDTLSVLYDERQITRALAGAIEVLAAEISKLYRAK